MNHRSRNRFTARELVQGIVCLAILAQPLAMAAEALAVTVEHLWAGRPMNFNALELTNRAGNVLSVSRLAYLVSGVSLHRANGDSVQLTNQFAYLNPLEGRNTFALTNIPAGEFTAVELRIGVDPDTNHRDPAAWPPTHPLNPNVNALHWNWQGGYVFLALEGHYLRSDGESGGYSFHIATDDQLMTVKLPVALNLASDQALHLVLNVDQIFNARYLVKLESATSSTHSRTNDPLAVQLRENIEQAFVTKATRGRDGLEVKATNLKARKIEMATGAVPYRLTISSIFPRPDLPTDNPLTEQGVALGRSLFFDSRLSRNNVQSCATCHQMEVAGADANKRFSIGVDGRAGTRNAMPLFNLAWKGAFFWDGRAPSLREQVLMPIRNELEMHETLTNVVAKLTAAKEYPALFEQAFGSDEITPDRVARALEQFLLTQISHDSKFDRVLAGDAQFTAREQRGFELFHTEFDPRRGQFGADCFHCHGGPLFANVPFANNGLDATPGDLGRYMITAQEGDRNKFNTPSLRNVELTAPYMHDGRFATLEEVIEHYSTGVKRSATLDPNLAKHPDSGLRLSAEDKAALAAFLKTLTDEHLRPGRPIHAASTNRK